MVMSSNLIVYRLVLSKKPGNIFLDLEGNVRLGDFGLATRKRDMEKLNVEEQSGSTSSSGTATLDEINPQGQGKDVDDPPARNASIVSNSTVGESMTSGVGTMFYRAPEQERAKIDGKDGSYNVKADIYSLGIVIFELFHQPFSTVSDNSSL